MTNIIPKVLIVFVAVIIVVVAMGFLYAGPQLMSLFSKPEAISIQDKQILYTAEPLKVDISYPQIAGLDDFNQRSKALVEKEINDFKKNALDNDEAVKATDPTNYEKFPREYELNISYTAGQVDRDIISTIFSVYKFEGGAHGTSYFAPLNYDPKLKQEIKLADMFLDQPDYLQKISAFCIADLTKQIAANLGNTSGTWIAEGAGPKEENFQFFVINKDSIVFYFPQYQVAYGAAGDFKVTMPR